MKKTFVVTLAVLFVLSIAGTAFAAANPFVDVPAKHWSYDAVAKLAKAGIIDGYGDGTFRGDKTLTRYEMAQIVAKAMAKSDKADAETKALVDKLAVEFAQELNNLGVRVAKLEKNQSNVKFSGDARIRYIAKENDTGNPYYTERVRLVGTGNVNDNTSFYLRWMVLNHNTMGEYNPAKSNIITDANFTTKGIIPDVDFTVGRYSLNLGQTTYLAGSTGMFDGVQLNWKAGKGNLMVGYADASGMLDLDGLNYAYTLAKDPNATFTPATFANAGNVYYAEYAYKFDNKVKANVTYVKNQDKGSVTDVVDIFGAGVTWKFANDWTLTGDYWKNSADDAKALNNGSSPKAYVARLAYKGAKASVPKSWGAFVEYVKSEPGAADGNWTGAMVNVTNIKAWDVQYTYTLAKNITLDAIYQFNMEKASDGSKYFKNNGDTYTRIQVNYMF